MRYTDVINQMILDRKLVEDQLDKKTWKNYLRTIISYILVIIFTSLNKSSLNKSNFNIGGLIIIIDILLGQQSRFITSNFEH